ncbi:MAG: MarR family transcriptional regulator [Sphingomonadales bacterium]|nr:MarR family transcriptional regulator [Sphingomonadales bacterium]
MAEDFATNVGFLLTDSARLLRKRFDQRARGIGVTRPQWRVLFSVARFPGINQARLAEMLEVEPITLCRLIDRMEQAGMVRRDADPADRRARQLFITEAGKPLLDKLKNTACNLHTEIMGDFSREELQSLTGMLTRIRDKLSEQGGDIDERRVNG